MNLKHERPGRPQTEGKFHTINCKSPTFEDFSDYRQRNGYGSTAAIKKLLQKSGVKTKSKSNLYKSPTVY